MIRTPSPESSRHSPVPVSTGSDDIRSDSPRRSSRYSSDSTTRLTPNLPRNLSPNHSDSDGENSNLTPNLPRNLSPNHSDSDGENSNLTPNLPRNLSPNHSESDGEHSILTSSSGPPVTSFMDYSDRVTFNLSPNPNYISGNDMIRTPSPESSPRHSPVPESTGQQRHSSRYFSGSTTEILTPNRPREPAGRRRSDQI